jgi:uncharacterized membrane protein
MKRTALSVVGGLLFLLAALGVGFGGASWAIYGNADSVMARLKNSIEAAKGTGNLTPEDQRKIEDAKAKLARMETELADPEKRAERERMAPYGYFEIAVGLVALIAGVCVLAAMGIGKPVGVIAGTLGVLSCVWGVIVGAPPGMPFAALVQMLCLIVFGVATIGALALKKKEPEEVEKEEPAKEAPAPR